MHIKTPSNPTKLHQKTHQTPSNSPNAYQNSIKPHQIPSNLTKPHQNPTKHHQMNIKTPSSPTKHHQTSPNPIKIPPNSTNCPSNPRFGVQNLTPAPQKFLLLLPCVITASPGHPHGPTSGALVAPLLTQRRIAPTLGTLGHPPVPQQSQNNMSPHQGPHGTIHPTLQPKPQPQPPHSQCHDGKSSFRTSPHLQWNLLMLHHLWGHGGHTEGTPKP